MAKGFSRTVTTITNEIEVLNPIIEMMGVRKVYSGLAGAVSALRGIDLRIYPGEFVAVTGKSGSGKTTLVNMIAGLDRSTEGEVWVSGTAVHGLSTDRAARWRGRTVGVIFQTFELIPSLTVLQNVILAMDFAHKLPLRLQRERALYLLDRVDILEHAHKRPSAVSGGQQQRVAIARALANDPPILVADEPTGSLDSATASAVLDIFEELVRQGKTILLVTHDWDICQRATRTLVLSDGTLASPTIHNNCWRNELER